jgi:long-chain acyl-CoA synthetase
MRGKNKMQSDLYGEQVIESLKKPFSEMWDDPFIFVAKSDRKVTYGNFMGMVCGCRKALVGMGFKEGDHACVIMPNSLDFVVLCFSLLTLKTNIYLINPKIKRVEMDDIMSKCGDKFKKIFDGIPAFESENTDRESVRIFDGIEDVFVTTFTSGSTGVPKGVIHRFRNLVMASLSFRERFGFDHSHTFYHNLPMSYMAGFLNLLILPMISGSKIVIDDEFSAEKLYSFWDVPVQYKVNVFWLVPTVVNILVNLERGNTGREYFRSHAATGCVGTAPLSIALKNKFEAKYEGLKLYESYGLSETLFVSTNYKNHDVAGDVGEVLRGVTLIRDNHGVIWINTPWNFYGYVGDVPSRGALNSGDIGVITDNRLRITGREKDIIIKGGVNISPRQLEVFLDSMGVFKESVVVGVSDNDGQEKTCCVFAADRNLEIDQKGINSKIIDGMGTKYKIDLFCRVDAIPKNNNSKVDKKELARVVKNDL